MDSNSVPEAENRLAELAMKALAAMNMLFFAAFLMILATALARAEETACTGKDMLAALAASDPAAVSRIEAAARETPNGEGLLWKLEKPGERPSWLFGTMHMTDPRVTALPASAQIAFDAADIVVIETTDVLDQARMMAAIAAEPELMMFTDGSTLTSHLSSEDAALVAKALDARGIPPASVSRMKPWMLSAMVALPACELARKAAGKPVLDILLAEEAQRAGKSLEGLETVGDQLRAMASLPMEFHMKGLVETLKLGDRLDDVIETMIVLYVRGDVGMFWPLFRAVLPTGTDEAAGYAAFEEAMINSRNRTMAQRALPILAGGNAFLAVGALHLPGKDGLVEAFRAAGYSVTAAP